MIIGTAGHIDHGKSTLVTALTGKAMDRLAEERRRGITIDLGFAPFEVDGAIVASIVDVPGHEDFVRTMVAGASGIDIVLLVVDAVEGIRPQTLEHLAVVEQLGIPRGIPVITKVDLAEADWIDLVEADLVERLARSTVQFGPVARVSAVSGAGIQELRDRLAGTVSQSDGPAVRPTTDLLRLPIDRAFAVAGVGTVVTGTLWSGSAAVGDLVRIEPGGHEARVRSVESHGRSVARAIPGTRTAVGLAGVDLAHVGRGQTLLRADDQWPPASAFDAWITLLPEAPRRLGARTRVRVHLGTAEVMARVHPEAPVAPGSSGNARLVLEAPVVARGGDRFVVRSYSPVTTIGGGWVTDPEPPRRITWSPGIASPESAVRLVALLDRRPQGIPELALSRLLGGAGPGPLTGAGATRIRGRLLAARAVEAARAMVLQRLERFHRDSPAEAGMSLETLRASLRGQSWLADDLLQALSREGVVRITEGTAALLSHRPASAGGEPEVDAVVAQVEAAGLEGMTVPQLAASNRVADLSGALRRAVAAGRVEAVERDRYLAAGPLGVVAAALREIGQGNTPIEPGALRDRIGLSRKHLIPLLEWADRKGITWRDREGKRRLKH